MRRATLCCLLLVISAGNVSGQTAREDFNWQIPGEGTNQTALKKLLINEPNLERLRVGWPGMGDETVKEIARFDQLSHLQVTNARRVTATGKLEIAISAVGWKELTALKWLRVLRISDLPLSDEAHQEIAKLNKLTTLRLDFCDTSDTAMRHFSKLKALTGLSLIGSSISDAAFKDIAKLDSLIFLDVSQFVFGRQARFTDDGLKELVDLKNLKELQLVGTNVTDLGLKYLAQVKSLRYLDTRDTAITEKGKKWLSSQNPELKFSFKPG